MSACHRCDMIYIELTDNTAALRGGANKELVDMLFKLDVPEGESFSGHVISLLSEPTNWAEAGNAGTF